MLLRRKDVRSGNELRSGHFSADGAWRDSHLRIVANALGLTHIAARHYVEFSIFLAEPHWSWNAYAGFSKCSQ